jgi:hypothetical protein
MILAVLMRFRPQTLQDSPQMLQDSPLMLKIRQMLAIFTAFRAPPCVANFATVRGSGIFDHVLQLHTDLKLCVRNRFDCVDTTLSWCRLGAIGICQPRKYELFGTAYILSRNGTSVRRFRTTLV